MRTYYGVTITPHGPNTMGMRWQAPAPAGSNAMYLRADTLEGLKELIRKYYNRGNRRSAR